MQAEHVGPEGVALLSGRCRNGPLTRKAFESGLRLLQPAWRLPAAVQQYSVLNEFRLAQFDPVPYIHSDLLERIARPGASPSCCPGTGNCCHSSHKRAAA
jgi:hypothetical protein